MAHKPKEQTEISDVIEFALDNTNVEITVNSDEFTLWIGDKDGDVIISLTPGTARGFALMLELAAQKAEKNHESLSP